MESVPQPLQWNELPCCGQCQADHPLAIKILFPLDLLAPSTPTSQCYLWCSSDTFQKDFTWKWGVLQWVFPDSLSQPDPLPAPPALSEMLGTLLPLWGVHGVKPGCIPKNLCFLPPKCKAGPECWAVVVRAWFHLPLLRSIFWVQSPPSWGMKELGGVKWCMCLSRARNQLEKTYLSPKNESSHQRVPAQALLCLGKPSIEPWLGPSNRSHPHFCVRSNMAQPLFAFKV